MLRHKAKWWKKITDSNKTPVKKDWLIVLSKTGEIGVNGNDGIAHQGPSWKTWHVAFENRKCERRAERDFGDGFCRMLICQYNEYRYMFELHTYVISTTCHIKSVILGYCRYLTTWYLCAGNNILSGFF